MSCKPTMNESKALYEIARRIDEILFLSIESGNK